MIALGPQMLLKRDALIALAVGRSLAGGGLAEAEFAGCACLGGCAYLLVCT